MKLQSSLWVRSRGGEQSRDFFQKEMAEPSFACGLSTFDVLFPP